MPDKTKAVSDCEGSLMVEPVPADVEERRAEVEALIPGRKDSANQTAEVFAREDNPKSESGDL